ncbi:MAG: hypothetical protein PHV34_07595 [Verrucomicrobiae bacterium]|nr:hypothetical protein [Verrucomicrobiae bacterium]
MKTKLFHVAFYCLSLLQSSAATFHVINDQDGIVISNDQLKLEMKPGLPVKVSAAERKESGSIYELIPVKQQAAVGMASWKLVENGAKKVELSVYGEEKQALFSVALQNDSEYIFINGSEIIDAIDVKAAVQVAVLPDQLAEDYLYFPNETNDTCYVPPGAHCLMNLGGNGSAIVSCIWGGRDNIVCLRQDRRDVERVDKMGEAFFSGNRIKFGADKSLCIGLLYGPSIWHPVSQRMDKVNFAQSGWVPLVPAHWSLALRIKKGVIPLTNMSLLDNTFDVWNLAYKGPELHKYWRYGMCLLDAKALKIWSTSLGSFVYPFYFENNGVFFKTPLVGREQQLLYDENFKGIIYPTKNCDSTMRYVMPLTKMSEVLPENLLRKLEIAKSVYDVFPATCYVTEKALRVFKDDQAQKEKETLKRLFDSMNKQVQTKRKRINEYRDWAGCQNRMLTQAMHGHDSLKPMILACISHLSHIEKCYDGAKEKCKTPEECAVLSQKILDLIDKDMSSEKKEEECDLLGREIRTIGGSQDSLIAKYRVIVKSLRQHLARRLAVEAKAEEVNPMVQVWDACGEILWTKHSEEGK